MKFSTIVVGLLSVSSLYVMAPVGQYTPTSFSKVVEENGTDSVSLFTSYYLENVEDKDEFAQTVVNKHNPTVGGLVHPSTTIARDGSSGGFVRFTSGYQRGANISVDKGNHRALDTSAQPTNRLGKCPSGRSACADTALIAPISGTINKVVHRNPKSDWCVGGHNSYISISGEGEWAGLDVRVFHMSNIPERIVVGYRIQQGEFIGYQCSLGDSYSSHCHMDVCYTTNPPTWTNRPHIKEWFDKITMHSSVEYIVDTCGDPVENKGWDAEKIKAINDKPRYDSIVSIE